MTFSSNSQQQAVCLLITCRTADTSPNCLTVAPLDQKFRDKNAFNVGSRLPAIVSGDLVGTVIQKGPDTSPFSIGDRVFSQMQFNIPTGGGLQEYTVINSLYTGFVPNGVSDTEAALYPINALTSAMALFSPAGFGWPFPGTPAAKTFDYASQKLVIVGGGSNSGKLAIQFARMAGVGTIVAVASLGGAAVLESYGATHVVARQAADLEAQVREIVDDDLLYVYDTFSFGDHSLGVSLLSNTQKGTLITLLPGKASETVLAQKKEGIKSSQLRGFSNALPEWGQIFWKEFPGWLEGGKVKPVPYKVIEGLDMDKVNAALDEYGEGKSGERYHVRIGG